MLQDSSAVTAFLSRFFFLGTLLAGLSPLSFFLLLTEVGWGGTLAGLGLFFFSFTSWLSIIPSEESHVY